MNRCMFGRKSLIFTAGVLAGAVLSWSVQEGAHFPLAEAQAKPAAVRKTPAPDTLRQDVSTLKDKATDQSHVMMDVAYHFTNLWFAGKAENWPLAKFYWDETLSHIRWAVRVIPVRKDNAGNEVKLRDILEGIENSQWMQIGKTIEEKDVEKFETAYRYTLEGCYSCHKAADKPYLRPRIPTQPAASIINFDPNATWPK